MGELWHAKAYVRWRCSSWTPGLVRQFYDRIEHNNLQVSAMFFICVDFQGCIECLQIPFWTSFISAYNIWAIRAAIQGGGKFLDMMYG